VAWEFLKPKETDWTVTLSKDDKIPYGTYIIFNTLEDVFPDKKIEINKKTLFEYNREENPVNKNFIFISKSFDRDSLEIQTMLKLINKGNNVFISAFEFSKGFMDTLNLSIYNNFYFIPESVILNFSNKEIADKEGYFLKKGFENVSISYFKPEELYVLGTRDEVNVNFIKKKIGKGNLYLHTEPMIFSNYHLISKKNYEYAYKALSHLPVRDVVWDEYGKIVENTQYSALRYIFKNKGLSAAYFVILFSLTVYMIFTARRRQRIIPIIKPYENSTVDFVNTVGRLYLHGRNHKNIAEKKYLYFLDFLRDRYYINISDSEDFTPAKIAEKTETDIKLIENIFAKIEQIKQAGNITDKDLLKFSGFIEEFYKETKAK